MRDLGKIVNTLDSQFKIERVVESIKNHLTHSADKKRDNKIEPFSMEWLYQMAQQQGIVSSVIWVVNKLKIVASNIPTVMDVVEVQRKIIKIIAGVLMHELDEMDEGISFEERT